MLSFIGFLIVGLVAGALARLLVPGKDPMGILGTMVLGIAGAFLGGFVAQALFNAEEGVGIIGATVGAILVLLVYRAVTDRGRSHSRV